MMIPLTLTLLAAAPEAQGAMPGNVGSGMISGGWGYVWTAYGIFWAGLALYTLSLFLRSRTLKKEHP
jgi:hypothetical protein